MDFNLTETQVMLVDNMKKMLTMEYDKAYFRKLEDDGVWPHEVMKKLGELGYMGIIVPEELGGFGGNALDVVLCIEQAARVMGGPAMAYFTTVCFGARALSVLGTREQQEKILPGLLAGTSFVGLSLTEANGGIDILNTMKTSARSDGEGNYVINGSKIFTTGAHIADWLIVVARTSGYEEKRTKGVTMFLVPTNSEGVTIEPIELFAQRSTGANHVFYDNVKVPEENILGELDKGMYSLFNVLNDERVGAAAMTVGIAQAALDEALEYAKVREAFGRPIGQFQAIQHKLAESWARIQAAKYLLYAAAWREANNLPAEMESSAAKLIGSETAVWVTNECMDVLGGYQNTLDFSMNYYFRDCRYTVAPVTNNAVKNLIGERLGLPKSY
ncbi:MAG: acyl-CoA/acyl-ACP dehydrogenase [Nitrospira sp.]|nr:acyl-CoA/acyl-ACP dehydrogenase [Nitrospira sp.]